MRPGLKPKIPDPEKQNQSQTVMSKQNQNETVEQVKDLQREVAELRAERKPTQSAGTSTEIPAQETETALAPASADHLAAESEAREENPDTEWDTALEEFSTHLGNATRELERAVRKRPGLALLGSFAAGLLIGQLFPRR